MNAPVENISGKPAKPGRETSTGIHLHVLKSWQQDCGHNSTKAPILWAQDNMPDKLTANIGLSFWLKKASNYSYICLQLAYLFLQFLTLEWIRKARDIWSGWKKVSAPSRRQYIVSFVALKRGVLSCTLVIFDCFIFQ